MAISDNFLLEPVPNDEAARWIRDKPLVSREVFDSLLPELKARAFLITGIEDANTLSEVRSLLAELPEGAEWEDTKQSITDKLSTWFTPEAAAARAEMLLRTHGFQAYQTAQHRVMERQADVFPYWQYLSLDDEKVRPAHAALNEKVVPAGDPFWNDHSPPWQWGCRCRKVALLPEDVEDIKAEDSGKLPEAQRVLEGTSLTRARDGRLAGANGVELDIRNDKMRGKTDGYHFDPSSLALDPAGLKPRYDDTTWADFETNAKRLNIEDGRSVWDWLNGAKTATTPTARPANQPAAQPSLTRTKGTPLTGKLDAVALTQKEQGRVNNVLAIIDSVHGDGPLPKIPVGNKAGKSLGLFTSNKLTKEPISINYRTRPVRNYKLHPELTLAHEIGHWIDCAGFGQGVDGWATKDVTGALSDWWKAVSDSTSFKALESDSRADYYTSKKEAWARSYAQFIAEESADQTLLDQVQKIRGEPLADRQWTTQDFAPIKTAMKQIFIKNGWMEASP
jgi:SPP1 gp7 family putative phage head morphogenesis protein